MCYANKVYYFLAENPVSVVIYKTLLEMILSQSLDISDFFAGYKGV